MADERQRLEAELDQIGQRLEKLRERMREDRSWEREDFGEMVLEVFDDIGKRLDHLLSRGDRQ